MMNISAIFYFLYFASFGIFVPYWTLYLRHLEFSSMQIAVIYAIPAIARIFLPVMFGYLADRWKTRKVFLIIGTAGQVIPLVLAIWFHSFSQLVALISLFAVFNSGVLPLTEATVQEEQEKGNLDYGRTRLWGTLSFILLAVLFGKLLDRLGDEWTLYGVIAFLGTLAAVSFAMPEGKMFFPFLHGNVRAVVASPPTWIFLACAFLMYASHGTFYGFYSIYLAQIGIRDSGIGVHWAVAAGSELSIFFFASWILKRFSSPHLLTVCCIAASLRWFLTGSSESYAWLTLYQCLHAFTFGAFHITSMKLIHQIFPEGARSFGQSLFTSLGPGLGSMSGILMNGYLWDHIAEKAFYVSGAMMLFAVVLPVLLMGRIKKQDGIDTIVNRASIQG